MPSCIIDTNTVRKQHSDSERVTQCCAPSSIPKQQASDTVTSSKRHNAAPHNQFQYREIVAQWQKVSEKVLRWIIDYKTSRNLHSKIKQATQCSAEELIPIQWVRDTAIESEWHSYTMNNQSQDSERATQWNWYSDTDSKQSTQWHQASDTVMCRILNSKTPIKQHSAAPHNWLWDIEREIQWHFQSDTVLCHTID